MKDFGDCVYVHVFIFPRTPGGEYQRISDYCSDNHRGVGAKIKELGD